MAPARGPPATSNALRMSDVPMSAAARPTSHESCRGRCSRRRRDPALATEMRPFHLQQKAEAIEPAQIYELRVELLSMSVLVRRGERLRLEISNRESAITEAP